MTYHNSGLIQASTYNTYAGIINSVYADTNAGSTVESLADYGYGLSPTISTVTPGALVLASHWTALFSKIQALGTHQGTSVSPIPSSVSSGQLITAYNSYLTTQTLTDVISKLVANRMQCTAGQFSIITGPTSPTSPSWGTSTGTKCLRYQFQIDFGSWDNARYFFNTGGAINIFGSGSGSTSEDIFWAGMLSNMGTLKFNWHNTTPTSGAASTMGFYNLTNTSYTKIFQKSPVSGGVAYSNSFIAVYGQLQSVPGTDGKVNIRVELVQNDPGFTATSAGTISFNVGLTQATNYPGPTVTNTAGTFTTTSNYAYPGVALTLAVNQTSAAATYNTGAGVATTSSITVTPTGGTGPYTYAWTKDPVSPADSNLTFSAPSSATTTVSYNLTAGQVASASVKVTVTDSASQSAYLLVPVSFNSNLPNILGS